VALEWTCVDQVGGEPLEPSDCTDPGEFVGGTSCDDDPPPCPPASTIPVQHAFPSDAEVVAQFTISGPECAYSAPPITDPSPGP